MMNVSEIIHRVKAAIGELSTLDNPRLAESVNLENIDLIIADKIPYAFEWVIQNAPVSLLDGELSSSLEADVLNIRDDNVLEVTLPSDVLRIVSARLSSWMYSPEVSDEHSDVAAMQAFPTTRGTYDCPSCVLYSEGGKQVLRMFSAKGKEDTAYITVIRKPTEMSVDPPDGTREVDVPARLEASFIYYISALTMQAMGENAQSFFEVATINLKTNGE